METINTKNFTILLALLGLSLLSAFVGYKLNDKIICQTLKKAPSQNEESARVSELQQQIADINTKYDRNIKSLSKAIAEAKREASDCRYVKIYHNLLYGFKISLPSSKWCSPSPYDKDPHLYDENGCHDNLSTAGPCKGLEIQDHSQDTALGIDQIFSQIKDEKRNPVILSGLVSDASVIKSKAPGPAEGWTLEYDIFFNNQRRLLIFSNNESFESVIKTLVLDK